MSRERVIKAYLNGNNSVTPRPGYSHIVSGVQSTTGNRRDPNVHAYTVDTQNRWTGQINTYNRDRLAFEMSGGLSGPAVSAPAAVSTSYLYNSCLSRLNDRTRGSLDLGTSLAELGASKRFISSVDRIPGIGGRIGALAGGFLAVQYGILPLLSDIYGASEEMQRKVQSEIESFGASFTSKSAGPVTRNGSIEGLGFSWQDYRRQKDGCRLNIRLSIPTENKSRWTSLNPATIGWNLIPFSFVIDWFINVGDYLRDLETGLLYGPRFVSGYGSFLQVYESKEYVPYGSQPNGSNPVDRIVVTGPLTQTRKRIQFSRFVLTSYPLPKIPSFKADLGSRRLLSAAAILTQILTNRR